MQLRALLFAAIAISCSSDRIRALPEPAAEADDAGPPGNAGAPDAGVAQPLAAADAGAPDASVAAADACAGIAAPSAAGMRSWSSSDPMATAIGGTSDGDGVLALLSDAHDAQWVDFIRAGAWVGQVQLSLSNRLGALAHGFAAIEYIDGSAGEYAVSSLGVDPIHRTTLHLAYGAPQWALPDVGAQFLIVGPFHDYLEPPLPQADWLDGSGALSATPLSTAAVIVAAGADGKGNSLVVFAGRAANTLDAQWFAPRAQPATAVFKLLDDAPAGLDVSPAVGGGVLVGTAAGPRCIAIPGSTTCTPVSAWMIGRANPHVVRNGRAWAFLERRPVSCTDTVEVVAPDGTSCGSVQLSQGACDRPAPNVGGDGTVVQPAGTATWRWWPAMLR